MTRCDDEQKHNSKVGNISSGSLLSNLASIPIADIVALGATYSALGANGFALGVTGAESGVVFAGSLA